MEQKEAVLATEEKKAEEAKTADENKVEAPKTETKDTKEVMAEVERLKKALSKANSEAAENKRKYLASLDEAQRAEAERAEKEAEKDRMLAEYMEKERVSSYKSKLMEAGIDANTADIMARSLPDGVKDEYFTAVKTFNGNQQQAFKAQALDNQPGLSVGMPPTGSDAKKEEENKMRGYFGLPPRK